MKITERMNAIDGVISSIWDFDTATLTIYFDTDVSVVKGSVIQALTASGMNRAVETIRYVNAAGEAAAEIAS